MTEFYYPRPGLSPFLLLPVLVTSYSHSDLSSSSQPSQNRFKTVNGTRKGPLGVVMPSKPLASR